MIPGITASSPGGTSPPGPVYEDLTTYTEVDPSSRLTVTAPRAAFTSFARTDSGYLYKDFGTDHFSGDVSVDFDVFLSSSSSGAFVEAIALANQVGDARPANRTNTIGAFLYATSPPQLHLREVDGGTSYSSTYNLALNTAYYCRFERDESFGTYGAIYLRIASSSANRASGTWLTSLGVTLHTSKKDFRYLYALAGYNDAGTPSAITGYTENYFIAQP